MRVRRIRDVVMLGTVLAAASCASIDPQPPATRPSGYENYHEPAACADPAAPKTVPTQINRDEVRRTASFRNPELFPSNSQVHILFLWYFIREDGTVADVRLWRSSRSPVMDQAALDAGRGMRWHPATCARQPVAIWYGDAITLGGSGR